MNRHPSPPVCPRCGYDFSGAVAAWQDACPLTGVCSECGLELWWGDALNPSLTVPKWSFEHAMRRRPRHLFATWRAALLPWRFWRDLRMEHEIRRRRLLVFALALCLLVHLGYAVEQGWRTSVVIGRPLLIDPWMSARAAAWPYAPYHDSRFWRTVWPSVGPVEVAALCLVVGAPLTLLVLPDTFKLARVRQLHILRGAVYGLAAPALAAITTSTLVTATIAHRQAARWPTYLWLELLQGIMVIATMAWFVSYWVLFTQRYLRLPAPGLVAAVALGLAALLAAAITTAIFPSDVGMLIFNFVAA